MKLALIRNKKAWKRYANKFNGWYTGNGPPKYPVYVSTVEANECVDMNEHRTLCTYHTFWDVKAVRKEAKKWTERLLKILEAQVGMKSKKKKRGKKREKTN